jgi:hypothetical protein
MKELIMLTKMMITLMEEGKLHVPKDLFSKTYEFIRDHGIPLKLKPLANDDWIFELFF